MIRRIDTTDEQIETIVRLAAEIWCDHYIPIIGRAQVEYMLGKFQSLVAIRDQLEAGYEYYLIEWERSAIGYIALVAQPENKQMFISKFYLKRSARGRGFGRKALEFVETLSRARGIFQLSLTVNKYNPALQSYLHMGFEQIDSIVADIGNGYVMDDYRMEKKLTGLLSR